MSGGQVTAVFIDLATRQPIDNKLYGGEECVVQLGRELRTVSWMAFIQTPIKKEPQGESCSYRLARSADAIQHSWLAVNTPHVRVKPAYAKTHKIAFTANLFHQLIKTGQLQFNDLKGVEFDTAILDDLSAHMEDPGKWDAYNSFIGNVPALTEFSTELISKPIKLPLNAMPWEKDLTNALLLCCLRMNEVRIHFDYNLELQKLIRVAEVQDDGSLKPVKANAVPWNDMIEVIGGKNGLSFPIPEGWAEYCMVTKNERRFHRGSPHNYLMEQYSKHDDRRQTAGTHRFDFRFNQPHRVLYFKAKNTTASEYNNHSNYTTNPFDASHGADPCKQVSLYYDQQARFEKYPADMFSTMMPYYHAKRVPLEAGYHMISYSNKNGLEPDCSTNLTVLSTSLEVITKDLAGDDEDEEDSRRGSKFVIQLRGCYHNIGLIQDDTFGFPNFSSKSDD